MPEARASNHSASPSFSQPGSAVEGIAASSAACTSSWCSTRESGGPEHGVAAHADHARVEAGRGEAEQAVELAIEDPGIVDHDLDRPRGLEAEQRAQPIVSRLQLGEHELLEAARAAQAARLVDRDVLVEDEVRGGALLELAVRAASLGLGREQAGGHQATTRSRYSIG